MVTRSGLSRLEALELLHERVELGVGDLGIVEDVVALLVVANEPTELRDAFCEQIDANANASAWRFTVSSATGRNRAGT